MKELSEFDEREHNRVMSEESEGEHSRYNLFSLTGLFNEKLTSSETKKSQIAQLIKQEIVEELRESFNTEKKQD